MQLSELWEYAGRRGWQIGEEFTDQGDRGIGSIDSSTLVSSRTAVASFLRRRSAVGWLYEASIVDKVRVRS